MIFFIFYYKKIVYKYFILYYYFIYLFKYLKIKINARTIFRVCVCPRVCVWVLWVAAVYLVQS